MKTAVHVDDFPGAERQQALGNGGDGFADILGRAPALDGRQAASIILSYFSFTGPVMSVLITPGRIS